MIVETVFKKFYKAIYFNLFTNFAIIFGQFLRFRQLANFLLLQLILLFNPLDAATKKWKTLFNDLDHGHDE